MRSAARSETTPAARDRPSSPGSSKAPGSRSEKNPGNLTERQKLKLARVQTLNQRLYRAYLLSQQLREIYRVGQVEQCALPGHAVRTSRSSTRPALHIRPARPWASSVFLLSSAHGEGVLYPVAGERTDRSVVHPHREVDRKRAPWVA